MFFTLRLKAIVLNPSDFKSFSDYSEFIGQLKERSVPYSRDKQKEIIRIDLADDFFYKKANRIGLSVLIEKLVKSISIIR